MAAYLQLLRVKQWIKNGFLFLPLFFDHRITELDCLLNTAIGFVAFCFFASTVYIINDYRDIEKDKIHPKKKKRPLAAGDISKQNAIITLIIIFSIALAVSLLFLPPTFLLIAIAYVIMNLLYSFGLKNIPILDIVLVSLGFIFRIFAGGAICSIEPSVWLVSMTFLLALFIAVAKRRDDVLIFIESGTVTRKAVEGYNLQFVNTAMSIIASVVIVSYLMYTISEDVTNRFGTDNFYFSGIFVVLGILRYLQLTFVEEDTGSPTELVYKDLFLQITIIGWVLFCAAVIYLRI